MRMVLTEIRDSRKQTENVSWLSNSSPRVSLRVFQELEWNQTVSFSYKSLQESLQILVAWFCPLFPLWVWMVLHRLLTAISLKVIFVSSGFIPHPPAHELMGFAWFQYEVISYSPLSGQALNFQNPLNKLEASHTVCTETWNPEFFPGALIYVPLYLLYGSNLFF